MSNDLLNGVARPHITPDAGDKVELARQSVMTLFNKLMDDATKAVPEESRTDLVEDIALFGVFMAAVKGGEFADEMNKAALIKRMRGITNRIEKEVPEQLFAVINQMEEEGLDNDEQA